MRALTGIRKASIDFFQVGQQHAKAAYEQALAALTVNVHVLELVPLEPDAVALEAVYGPVSAEQWSTYRDAYRSTLHGLNMRREAALTRAQRRALAQAVQ